MFGRRQLAISSGLAAAMLVPPAMAQTAVPDSTFATVRRTKRLRVGVVSSAPPYSYKDPATGDWHGLIITCARDLAAQLGAEPIWVETVFGNGVLDLQSNKIDLFYGLNATPQRALSIDFSGPMFKHPFTLVWRNRKPPATWDELDRPEVKISVDLGGATDLFATAVLPRATLLRYRTLDEATLALIAGKSDYQVLTLMLSLATLSKNPSIGHRAVPSPLYGAGVNIGVPREPDHTWRDYVDVWLSYYKDLGLMRRTAIASLAPFGATEADLPAEFAL